MPAKRSSAKAMKSYLRMELVTDAPIGPSQWLEVEFVAQMFVKLVKS